MKIVKIFNNVANKLTLLPYVPYGWQTTTADTKKKSAVNTCLLIGIQRTIREVFGNGRSNEATVEAEKKMLFIENTPFQL